jgi:hypothetical protein
VLLLAYGHKPAANECYFRAAVDFVEECSKLSSSRKSKDVGINNVETFAQDDHPHYESNLLKEGVQLKQSQFRSPKRQFHLPNNPSFDSFRNLDKVRQPQGFGSSDVGFPSRILMPNVLKFEERIYKVILACSNSVLIPKIS